MSDDIKPQVQPDPKGQTYEIKILVQPETGKIFVTGPMHLKVLMLHALADAMNVLIDFEPKIQPAKANDMPKLTVQ